MCTDILTVIVGSQLHGLASPTSDEDFRGVFINDLDGLVNPFEKPPENRWLEGKGKDDTATELRKFVREVVSGNPNAVEVLFSNRVVQQDFRGDRMVANREKFINTQNVFNAYKNYSANQMNKMNLFDPDARTPKFAVAYIRSLLNGVELLRDGTITNPVPAVFTLSTGGWIPAKEVLTQVKFTPFQEFERVRPLAMEMFAKLQLELSNVFYENRAPQAEDRDWIVDFVASAYLD